MLSDYFGTPASLQRVQACTAAPHLDGYADAMEAEGYASVTIQERLRTAVHLATWTREEGVSVAGLDEAAIKRFRRHLPACSCPGPQPRRSRDGVITNSALRFLGHLRKTGVVSSAAPQPASPPTEATILVAFRAWMQQHRGARPATINSYGRVIADAISVLGNDPQLYDAAGLRAFVLKRSKLHGRSKAKLIMTAMRMFLRYLVAAGMCRAGLDSAIPTIARWRLSTLPRYLTPSEVDQVVDACDSTTPRGLRNRAILLLLSRLGLRAGDVAELCLSDIDWGQATICVSGKGRQAARLPLPQDVGDSILLYLSRGRSPFRPDRVFLREVAPQGPIVSGTVSSIVHRAIQAAGLTKPLRGAHVMRHSAAVRMLKGGASLEQISALLRHRDPETTMLYAKVDVELLRQVAQPWPEVTP